MATQILQAHVGAGKTEAVLQALSSVVDDKSRPFARVWVLLASGRQEVAFRQRLADLPDARHVYFNAEVFNFPKLYDRLLKLTHQPRQRVNDATRLSILRNLLHDLQQRGELNTFASIADRAGFARLIDDFIAELKQNLIPPDDFARQVQTAKDADIARIYQAYQQTLIEHHLVDAEGEAWLTLEALQHDTELARHVDLLIVDGFDQFSEVQAHILATISAHIGRVLITLTALAGREQTVGRRFQRAFERIQKAHAHHDVPFSVQPLTAQPNRHPDLQNLSRDLFDLNVSPHTPHNPDSIRFFSASEPAQEVALVLRDVKRRLLTGTPPDEMLIALRDWHTYNLHFEVFARVYDIPLLTHYAQPIVDNPVISILLKALHLAPTAEEDPRTGFRPRDVLQILHSPYVNIPDLDANTRQHLEQIVQEGRIISGRQAWFDCLDERFEINIYRDDEDDERFVLTAPDLDRTITVSLTLQAFFDAVTMPDYAPLSEYVARIEQLIGVETLKDDEHPEDDDPFNWSPQEDFTFDMVRSIRHTHHDPTLKALVVRDIQALQAFKDILRNYLANAELLQNLWGRSDEVAWANLRRDLQESVANYRPMTPSPARNGRVLVTTATNARGLPHDHVYILGLSEGIFPAPRKEDPLYLDNERLALRERGIHLPTQSEKTDDAGIFYELINLARHSLTLARSTVQGSKSHNESYLWRITRETFTPDSLTTHHLKIGELPPPAEVASLDEAYLSLADAMTRPTLPSPDVQTLHAWLTADAHRHARWRAILDATTTERRRGAPVPHDAYTGVILQTDLRAEIHAHLLDDYPWSASQFNQIGACAYQFFASRLLRLEPLYEPAEGFDNLQYGTLIHTILERIYAQIRAETLAIHPDNATDAHEIAHDMLTEVLATLPEQLGVNLTPQWHHEKRAIHRQIIDLVTLDFSPQSPLYSPDTERTVYAVEQALDEHLTLRDWHAPVRVRGYIDRIDRIGDQLHIIDYKTGKPPGKSDLQEGRNYQMFVYIRAMQTLLKRRTSPQKIVAGYFWQLKGDAKLTAWQPEEDAFAHAEAHLVRMLQALHQANFAVAPNKRTDDDRCQPFCPFYQFCRLANVNPYKNPT